jgi:hypothetical protein
VRPRHWRTNVVPVLSTIPGSKVRNRDRRAGCRCFLGPRPAMRRAVLDLSRGISAAASAVRRPRTRFISGVIWPGWFYGGDNKASIRRPLDHIVMIGERAALPCDTATSGSFSPLITQFFAPGAVNGPRWIAPGDPEQGYNIASRAGPSASKPQHKAT